MEQRVAVQAMQAEDLAAVLEIQLHCYDEAKVESRQSFLAKLNASPTTCFIGCVAEVPVAYLVAVPSEAGNPPPWNCTTFSVPRVANALYLHDLAVRPEARGSGAASALVEAYFHGLRESKVQFACLVAVNESGPYWERYGFRSAALTQAGSARMATYGEGAQYMSMRVSA